MVTSSVPIVNHKSEIDPKRSPIFLPEGAGLWYVWGLGFWVFDRMCGRFDKAIE